MRIVKGHYGSSYKKRKKCGRKAIIIWIIIDNCHKRILITPHKMGIPKDYYASRRYNGFNSLIKKAYIYFKRSLLSYTPSMHYFFSNLVVKAMRISVSGSKYFMISEMRMWSCNDRISLKAIHCLSQPHHLISFKYKPTLMI